MDHIMCYFVIFILTCDIDLCFLSVLVSGPFEDANGINGLPWTLD